MTTNGMTVSVSEEFTVNDLRRVRDLVGTAAQRIGLSNVIGDNLVTAVNEIVVNAVRYAGGRGHLTICTDHAGLSVEVRDSGPGLPPGMAQGPAAADAPGGRGLWMARQMCERLTVSSSAAGLTVSLFVSSP